MSGVRFHAQDMPMSVDVVVETLPGHCHDTCAGQECDSIQRESLSQPLVNVSQDMCPIVTGVEPQALSLFKSHADAISEECSQVPANSAQTVPSQQPAPEYLASLGIKVRDFAYESTLPAITPVPRVPRQVQPTPPTQRALKRAQRDWNDEAPSSPSQLVSEQTGSKKLRSLERKPTEPLQEPEPVIRHTRALERITAKRLYSILTPSPRSLATPPRAPSASPPTSPLTPPLSHLESQESDIIRTPSAFPFAVHVDDTSMIPASQLDSVSQPVPFPAVYNHIALEPLSSICGSPIRGLPHIVSSTPLIDPFVESSSEIKEPGEDPRVRKRRGRGIVKAPMAPSNRYHLRQRPTSSSRASTLSQYSRQASGASRTHSGRARR